MTIGIECVADPTYTPIHHIRWSDDVAARVGVDQGLPDQQVQCAVVVDITPVQEAAMAVIGVFAQTHIGDDEQIQRLVLDGANRLGNDAMGVVSAAAYGVFALGYAEKNHRRDPEIDDLATLLHEHVHRHLIGSRHGGDLPAHSRAGTREQGQDQVVRSEPAFANHPA